MLRPTLLLGLLALGLVPLAEAQQNTSMTITVTPPAERLTHEAALVFEGATTVMADVTVHTNLNGMSLQYTVTEAPAWAIVTVSPQSDIVWFSPGLSPSASASRSFTVTVEAAPDMLDEALGAIEITATVSPSAPGGKGNTAKATVPIHLDAATPCDAAAHADASGTAAPEAMNAKAAPDIGSSAPAATAPAQDTPLTVQSGPAPYVVPSLAVIGGFALAGAGVGYLVRRRR